MKYIPFHTITTLQPRVTNAVLGFLAAFGCPHDLQILVLNATLPTHSCLTCQAKKVRFAISGRKNKKVHSKEKTAHGKVPRRKRRRTFEANALEG